MTELLHSVREGRILQLTLNRPEKRNALDAALCRDLVEAVEDAAHDCEVGAVLLTANGKAFSAGMDLAEVEQGVDTTELNILHERLFTLGERMTKPIIGAVNGAALGGGTGLVANCHIVVASPDATFGLTEIRLGLWPFLIYRSLAGALGERRTLELALTGRIFDAVEARGMLLIHQIAADPLARAREVAAVVAGYSPTAVQRGLAFVQESRASSDSHNAGHVAQKYRNQVFGSPDFKEGIRAFRERRAPRWPSIEDMGH